MLDILSYSNLMGRLSDMRGKIKRYENVQMKITGIDPGLSGAWCTVDFYNKRVIGATFGTFPKFKRRVGQTERSEYRLQGMLDVLKFPDSEVIYLEHVWAFPMDTPMTAFKFGKGLGIIETCLVANGYGDYKTVPPITWEGIMHLGITKGLTPKTRSAYRVSEIFPELLEETKKDGVIDAFLIAVYGYFKESGVIIR